MYKFILPSKDTGCSNILKAITGTNPYAWTLNHPRGGEFFTEIVDALDL